MEPVEPGVIRTEYTKRPGWMKDYRGTIQINEAKMQIGYLTNDDTYAIEQYKTKEKFEQEKNYCHLWRVNGGNCQIIYAKGQTNEHSN